jgi:hypothetical protein
MKDLDFQASNLQTTPVVDRQLSEVIQLEQNISIPSSHNYQPIK